MHFARFLGISLLPTTSLAVPVALSLSIVVNDGSTTTFAHRDSDTGSLGSLSHDRFVSAADISPGKYLNHLAEYGKKTTEAVKLLKELKVPGDQDDDDTFSKADTKTVTEALAHNFAKINETLINPITAALKSDVLNDYRSEAHRLELLSRKLGNLMMHTIGTFHWDNKDDEDRSKDSEDDRVNSRNIQAIVDAVISLKTAARAVADGNFVQMRHGLSVPQWRLQL
ncbi:hypothetical protein CBER1_00742 [Cercospora berteroae]|uniref:Uncharacterized protein n=1 Tax=Cercospora berteroae TaxID=357750 RepID=A0A2S6C9J9_9PEZI|nr:hypothetical protein CBER1_00742 [Cercospora berteroae]